LDDGTFSDHLRRRIMRKIMAGLFISLDGVVGAPDQWHFPYFNEEMGGSTPQPSRANAV